MDFWYSALKITLQVYRFAFIGNVLVRGAENIPPGPKIVVANHPNTTNAVVLPFIFPERLYFLISDSPFTYPLWGTLLRLSNQIPVVPGDGKTALGEAAKRLSQGESVVVLPEGRTNPLGHPCKAGSGAVRLSLLENVPIVPVGFYIPEEFTKVVALFGKKRGGAGYFQVGGPCYVNIGEPWNPQPMGNERASGFEIRALTNQLMERVYQLAFLAKEEYGR